MKNTQMNCLITSNNDHSIFSFCSEEEKERLELTKACQLYKKGQPIFQEESMPMGVYSIVEGLVKITKLGSNGKEQIIRIVKPGDIFGFKSLLKNSRYRASAVAIEDSSICLIPRTEFNTLMYDNRGFYDGILKLLCEAIDETEEKLTDIAYKPVRGRIAEALLLLDRAFEDKEHITLTREDLAGLVGTVKETAIRIISEFKHDKLIEINKRSIKVVNQEGLIKISHLYD